MSCGVATRLRLTGQGGSPKWRCGFESGSIGENARLRMLLDLALGPLTEPLTGRHWDRGAVVEQWRRRLRFHARNGLAPGDRVFLCYGNTLEFFVDLVALWSLGACVVPIDARLTAFEIETLAEAASPRFAVWDGVPDAGLGRALAATGVGVLDANEAAAEAPYDGRAPSSSLHLDDAALILFTSGTTGAPKGVVHTHRSLRARWISLRQCLGLEVFRRTLCLLPTHFGHGLICNSLFPWLSGQHLFILPAFRPEVVLQLGPLLDEHRITFLSSVPAVWRLALKAAQPPRVPSLQRLFCGSAPLSAHLWTEIRRWTGTDAVWNAYGITETGSWLAGTSMADFTPEDGLVGEAWGGVVRVMRTRDAGAQLGEQEPCLPGENGHVWVNTPALMNGYLGRDDLTAEVVSAGWFLTGDIGFVDDRGWLYLRGREREEINKGGMKVYPGDVDAVAERFAETVDACTFAIEDPLLGEEIGVAVVLRKNDEETLRSLHHWMAERLAKHQMPKRWYVVDEIPRSSRGKVNRAGVAATCGTLRPVDLRGLLRQPG
jgi:acyl-CoA synthetase (AMP-forming)/AMP-acid ligase II